MYYVVTFDGCAIEGPLQAQSPISTLALAQEAERSGCKNVMIKVPDGYLLPIHQFASEFCHAEGPRAEKRPTDAIGRPELSSAAAELGREGGKKRAEKLTPERRKEIARNAAGARWKGGVRLETAT